jgi:hypothetical protein
MTSVGCQEKSHATAEAGGWSLVLSLVAALVSSRGVTANRDLPSRTRGTTARDAVREDPSRMLGMTLRMLGMTQWSGTRNPGRA